MGFGPEGSEGPYRMTSEGLPTYLVHGSREKLNSLCFHLFLIFLL